MSKDNLRAALKILNPHDEYTISDLPTDAGSTIWFLSQFGSLLQKKNSDSAEIHQLDFQYREVNAKKGK